MSASYEHFEIGALVRIDRSWRSASGPDGDRFSSFDDHPAGLVGTVRSKTNAGFRGLEYSVETDEGCAYGIPAGDLSPVEAPAFDAFDEWCRQNGEPVTNDFGEVVDALEVER